MSYAGGLKNIVRGKTMRKVGYMRVSTKEQNEARQLAALRQYVSEDMIVIDRMSGRTFNRPAYESLKVGLSKLEKDDELYITELDRLGRNKTMIKKELEYWKEQGVILKILNIATTMMEFPEGQRWIQEMITNIIIEVLASEAEQEVERTKNRQLAGIAEMPIIEGKRYSKKKKSFAGRPNIEYPSNWTDVYERWKSGEITATEAMKQSGLKRNTFYKLKAKYENNLGSA